MYTINKSMTDKLLTFKSQNKSFMEEAEAINKSVFMECVCAFHNNGDCKYSELAFTEKYVYQYVDIENGKAIKGIESITIKSRPLSVRDVFILRPSKTSTKFVLENSLKSLLDCTCGNLAKNYMTDRESFCQVKVYAKYDNTLECFVCETSSSINQLEKQVNRFFEIFFGEDRPIARKEDVRILIDSMTQAKLKKNDSGYVTSGELVLLDKLLILAYECKNNRSYNWKGKFSGAKKPKNTDR